MRRIIAAVFVLFIGSVGYIASPFVAAWTLREAIKKGDVATIERKVVWDGVRATLRQSLATNSQLMPEVNDVGERIKPTVWQRVKSAFGQSMLDRFIESYVTPEGLPKLFQYRKTWNGTMKGQTDDEDKLDAFERAKTFYRRMIRAEFKSPTRIEIEMTDRHTPDRRYLTIMELHGFEWKLAELHVIGATAKPGARVARDVVGLP